MSADLLNWHNSSVLSAVAAEGAGGMNHIDLRHKIVAAVACILLLPASGFSAAADDLQDESKGPAAAIISKYLQATQNHEDALRGASMEVDIRATVFKLKEQGRLHALRNISKVGQITYHVLGFQGDNTVKNQVIGRYLQAEQQGQGDQNIAITPANYKFKFKGEKKTDTGQNVYVFQLSPRKKKIGLFKGEMWLDSGTCLPVFEKGRLVKNPSIFFKKVDFERAFAVRNGVAIPQYIDSTIDTHLIGKVVLTINFSNFTQNSAAEQNADTMNSAAISSVPK